MQAENWKKVKEILAEVLALEFSERQDYLEKAEISGEIRQEVESLLAVEEESASLMNLTAVEFSKDFFDGEENPLIGQQVGVYRIVRELGYGGMGAVYLAERTDGKFAQRVAVKMLKREYNIEKIRRNFEREKEILATLSHPNIATLIDAGTTAAGVPFLVMEFVEGVSIDKFCQNRRLSLTERLKLFTKVCAAVGFAHRNLIVHRDLKPSNILVTANGEPKLLDFGISKLLDAQQQTDDKTAITILGAMTPEYASPEQIKGEQVTTATDIYSLGVVLFKILTDTHPFDLQGKTNGELLSIITDSEPTLPSAAMSEPPAVAGGFNYGVDPSATADGSDISPSQLKGDLDNIILKSLRKEPTRRYQTVEQFSADIWRFIDGLPVSARPATFAYRASKFYGRNKISVLAIAFVIVSLLTGLTVALWQADVARGQARLAELETTRALAEEEKAKAEKEKAEKISRFMFKVLAYANPNWYAEGAKSKGEAKVIEVMDELSDKIDVEFANQPDVQSELHHRFAEVYLNNVRSGQEEKAAAKSLYHARRALELRRQFYGERHELVAKDLVYLHWCGGVEKKDWAKHLTEAINMMRETNPHNLNLPYMLEEYAGRLMLPEAETYHEQYLQAVTPTTTENKYQIAERYLLEALPIFREHYKEDNRAIYSNECRLAYAQLKQNKVAEAAPHLAICRAAMTKLKDENQLNAVREDLARAEEAAAETNR